MLRTFVTSSSGNAPSTALATTTEEEDLRKVRRVIWPLVGVVFRFFNFFSDKRQISRASP
jgi:hypothetical protein